MMHGPCGNANPNCPCMKINDAGKLACSKCFPKSFNPATNITANCSYPEYRRRRMAERDVVRGKSVLDNRHVIPYNPYLMQKLNCHINVESGQKLKAVKYIYKYIYKGHDEGALHINQETPSEYNENK